MTEPDDLSRRDFFTLVSAGLALAGLDGCTRMPAEKILPFVHQPPELTPGVPLHYATSMVLDGYATGLVVEAHVGRPTKIEGNPDHPASLGAAGVLEQASLFQLYDPCRATRLRSGNSPTTWEALSLAMAPGRLEQRVGASGEGLAVLLEPSSSPFIADRLARLRELYPAMGVYFYSPLRSGVLSRTEQSGAMNASVVPQYDILAANVLLAIDADFLANMPFHLRYAREFADRRREPLSGMNRLYVMEPSVTVTGGAADHRLRCRPTAIESLLTRLLALLTSADSERSTVNHERLEGEQAWLSAVADDLRQNAGKSLVIGGDGLSSHARALVNTINSVLGNIGHTVWYTQSPLLHAGEISATLPALVNAMEGGEINTLVCLGGNPSYNTPASLQFSSLLRKVPNSIYLGLYENETARDVQHFIPAAHYLETWGDARAYDGTLSVVQPLVQPLHGGKSPIEVLSALSGDPSADPLSMLRDSWRRSGFVRGEGDWHDALRNGFVAWTKFPRISAPVSHSIGVGVTSPSFPAQREILPGLDIASHDIVPPDTALHTQRSGVSTGGQIDVIFKGDARVYDGSFANNGWLQELPDPVTKLTWDNAAFMSADTAERIGVQLGDLVELERDGTILRIPAFIVPGFADETVALHFGYGRTGAETAAHGIGTDVYVLWPSLDTYLATDISIRRDPKGTGRHDFAVTQKHWTMEGRNQARSQTLAAYQQTPRAPAPVQGRPLTIYEPVPFPQDSQQWAMTIDLGTCIGCSACVVACQAENNTPVVGRDDVAKSREMHWLRIDRYQEGSETDPEIITQPMLCQHCENAPCEYVCPVGATDHSPEGLNEMIYNRCVGTRFCSNNCPYKVRRFNWFNYNAELSETEQMAKNPDVTVRQRGVMEKCTFCVQRIRESEISAQNAGRPLRGDEVKTACQQACPTNAIVFGSLTEPDSDMVRMRAEPRVYSILEELGTQPRVQYLARIRNHNPALKVSV